MYKYLIESSEKRFVKKLFGQYVNENLLKELEKNPDQLKLGGETKNMTVLFSDIRGFTTISEGLNPAELLDLINTYLDEMSNIILKNNGTIDKYIGDAIMAFWNAPLNDESHTFNAVNNALQMIEKLKLLRKSDTRFTNLNIGIGINTGDIIVGNVGSSKRYDYTVLGDNVNLGSRLEGLNKKYGTKIIISQTTYEQLSKNIKNVIFRLLDKVTVKGKSHAIQIYQPMKKTKRNLYIKKMYENAFELYSLGHFVKAKNIFEQILVKYKDSPTKKYDIQIRRF